jgi:hypothetical protein
MTVISDIDVCRDDSEMDGGIERVLGIDMAKHMNRMNNTGGRKYLYKVKVVNEFFSRKLT